ncbi:MAG: cation transporter [Bacillota bacterium]
MRKHYKMVDLDCANCASKMECAIRKLDGVQDANVNFMAQKLTVEAPEERFEQIMDQIEKVCKRIEPDCAIQR